jgi:sugar-specific transcriptional regulator TrmB
MDMLKEKMLSKLYEEDYPLWVEKNLELLRNKRYEEVDWEHLLEEIEDMGRSDLKECISHLAVVLEDMYKWDHYRNLTKGGEKGGEGWKRSIKNGRNEIEVLLEDYPSLRKKLPLEIEKAWRRAKVRIVRSLGMMGKDIEIKDLPERCPYSYKEAMEREIK